jgi:hypothetical protein
MSCSSGSSHTPFPITGSFSNSSLNGQYAFILSGTRAVVSNGIVTQSDYQEAGVFTANGSGSITSGREDIHQLGTFPGLSSAVLTGSYSIGKDGNGTLTLNVSGGTETWFITMVSSSKFYLTEADDSITFSANAAGQGEQQDPTVLSGIPSGTFAFRVHQAIPTPPSGAMVGQFTATGGSAVGQVDTEQLGVLSSSPAVLSGTFALLDSLGRGTFKATIGGTATNFNYYLVNATTLLLLESDSNALGLGRAEAQSLPFSATSFSGSYAFGTSGDSQNKLHGINSVGAVSVSGTALTGNYDSSRDGTSTVNQAVTGVINSFDPTTGRTTISLAQTGGEGLTIQEVLYLVNPTRAFSLVYYPNLPMIVEDGTIDQQVGAPFSNASFKGQYGFVMGGFVVTGPLTIVGTLAPDGSSNLNLTESTNLYSPGATVGTTTVNPSATVTSPSYVQGSYTASGNGRVTAPSLNLVLYMVSGNKAYELQGGSGTQLFGPTEAQP